MTIYRKGPNGDVPLTEEEEAAQQERPFKGVDIADMYLECFDRVETHAHCRPMYALVGNLIKEIAALRQALPVAYKAGWADGLETLVRMGEGTAYDPDQVKDLA